MKPKRLFIAIIAVFLAVWVTDFLIHGLWLEDTYKATMPLWRPEKEMQAHLGWLLLGQFLAAATFVVLWARGFAEKACIVCAVMYGLFMGLFHSANTLVIYAVQPMPGELMAKWFIAGVARAVLLGLLVFFVYKPAPKPDGAGK